MHHQSTTNIQNLTNNIAVELLSKNSAACATSIDLPALVRGDYEDLLLR